jgi:hypothetical protein
MKLLNLAPMLFVLGGLGGCPLENVIRAANPDDPVAKMQDAAYITYQPATQEPPAAVEPEPYTEPPCEDIRWRYIIYDCHWNPKGTYDE